MPVHCPEKDWSTELFGFLNGGPENVPPIDFFEFLFFGVWLDEGEIILEIIGSGGVIRASGDLGSNETEN